MTTLFDPLRLGDFEITNRIVMAPLTRDRAGPGQVPTALMAEYYRQRASAGLIISEASQVCPEGQGYLDTPGIYNREQVAGWRHVTDAVHAEGGRIVVTTPNCYAATRRRLRELRLLIGGGAGITVEEILATPTHGHHWKEYSLREVECYFGLLSPDFVIHRSVHVEDGPLPNASPGQRLSARIRGILPVFRSRLHVEIGLPLKRSGIVAEPRWS